MPQDATRVRVALTGTVWNSDIGAVVPADITVTPAATWADAGYTTEDGVTFSVEQNTEDLPAWQSNEALRTIVTSEPKSFNFTLRQLERQSFLLAFGGTVTTIGANNYRWTPPTAGAQLAKQWIIEFLDGALKYRFVYRNCVQQGARELNFVRSNAVNIPLSYKVLAASPQTWELQTNDPAFA
jgi:hypothetical protein